MRHPDGWTDSGEGQVAHVRLAPMAIDVGAEDEAIRVVLERDGPREMADEILAPPASVAARGVAFAVVVADALSKEQPAWTVP